MATVVDVEIKGLTATTAGADPGTQIVTMTFICDDTVDASQWKEGQHTGIELPSHAGPR